DIDAVDEGKFPNVVRYAIASPTASASDYPAALMISTNSRDFSDAPPTRPPSTSAEENSSPALEAFTLPPYSMEISNAVASPYLDASCWRMKACISWACAAVAVLPVPMAQTGS